MPRVTPSVFDQIAETFAGRTTTPMRHSEFLANVLLPAVELVGMTFDELTLKDPGHRDRRTEVVQFPGGTLWLKATREVGMITVFAVEVVFTP